MQNKKKSFEKASAGRRALSFLDSVVQSVAGLNDQLLTQLGVAVVSKLLPLLSIFVYSRYMSVGDYGIFNLSQSYQWIFVLVLSLNLHVSIGRYIYEVDPKEGPFLGSLVLMLAALSLLGAVVIYVSRQALTAWLSLPLGAIVLMFLIALGMLVESLFTQLTIRERQGRLLFQVLASKACISFFLSLILLEIVVEKKYIAILFAEAVAFLGMVAYVSVRLKGRVEWTFNREHIFYMFKYAVPLIPYMLGLTLLSQFDRVILNRYFGNQVTGYYSLGYNVGALLMMAVGAALNAFTPDFFDALNKKNISRVMVNSKAIFDCAVVGCLSMVLFGPYIAELLLPTRYKDGFNLIPVVALGSLCAVIFQSWVRVLAYEHRTSLISGIVVVGALLNMGLNLWLVPHTGYQTAAYTSLVSYLVMGILCVIAVNKVSPIRINLWQEAKWICLIGALIPLEALGGGYVLFGLKVLFFFACSWVLRSSLSLFRVREGV